MSLEKTVELLNKYFKQLVDKGSFFPYYDTVYYIRPKVGGKEIHVMLKKVDEEYNLWESLPLTNQEAISILERYEGMLGFCSREEAQDDN